MTAEGLRGALEIATEVHRHSSRGWGGGGRAARRLGDRDLDPFPGPLRTELGGRAARRLGDRDQQLLAPHRVGTRKGCAAPWRTRRRCTRGRRPQRRHGKGCAAPWRSRHPEILKSWSPTGQAARAEGLRGALEIATRESRRRRRRHAGAEGLRGALEIAHGGKASRRLGDRDRRRLTRTHLGLCD